MPPKAAKMPEPADEVEQTFLKRWLCVLNMEDIQKSIVAKIVPMMFASKEFDQAISDTCKKQYMEFQVFIALDFTYYLGVLCVTLMIRHLIFLCDD